MPAPAPVPVRVAEPSSAPVVAGLHVLMINGGGTPAGNYQSDYLHLRQLLHLLHQGGVPAEDVTVFSGDGHDPKPDTTVREAQREPAPEGCRAAAAPD